MLWRDEIVTIISNETYVMDSNKKTNYSSDWKSVKYDAIQHEICFTFPAAITYYGCHQNMVLQEPKPASFGYLLWVYLINETKFIMSCQDYPMVFVINQSTSVDSYHTMLLGSLNTCYSGLIVWSYDICAVNTFASIANHYAGNGAIEITNNVSHKST